MSFSKESSENRPDNLGKIFLFVIFQYNFTVFNTKCETGHCVDKSNINLISFYHGKF